MLTKKRVNVALTERQLKFIKSLAEEDDLSLSEELEVLFIDWLDRIRNEYIGSGYYTEE